MSSLENIYQKMMPTFTPASPATTVVTEPASSDPSPQMSREVAHDLNNILTLIQGYAERMIMRHGDNPALRPDLQLITQNAKRAALVVRRATPRRAPLLPAHLAE